MSINRVLIEFLYHLKTILKVTYLRGFRFPRVNMTVAYPSRFPTISIPDDLDSWRSRFSEFPSHHSFTVSIDVDRMI